MTDWNSLLSDASQRSIRYIQRAQTRRIVPTEEALREMNALESLPQQPQAPGTTLDLLDRIGSPATVINAGGRFFGFVNGGSLPAAVAAGWLATAWDQNAGLRIESPIGAKLEDISRQWLLDLLKLPDDTSAGFVTGATMANFTGLLAARHAVLDRVGWDAENQGLFGAPPITVVVGDEVHASMLRALSMAGLGSQRVVRVPTDDQGRMRSGLFPDIRPPAIVCLQAGNVNTGSFDPATEICPKAHAAGAWVHVDGAFGLWAAAAPARAHLVAGFDQADSLATDCHKWLNVPYDSGVAFVRQPEHLEHALSFSAAYLAAGSEREPMRYTPEMSRRARGTEVWAALHSLGRTGLADLIERTCGHAAAFADRFRRAGFEVLNDVVLNQVMVSFGSDTKTQNVIREVQQEGTCWCGGTVWRGRAAMRVSVSSWVTTEDDVSRSAEAIIRIANAIP